QPHAEQSRGERLAPRQAERVLGVELRAVAAAGVVDTQRRVDRGSERAELEPPTGCAALRLCYGCSQCRGASQKAGAPGSGAMCEACHASVSLMRAAAVSAA